MRTPAAAFLLAAALAASDAVAPVTALAQSPASRLEGFMREVQGLEARWVNKDTVGLLQQHQDLLARIDAAGAGSSPAALQTLRGLTLITSGRRDWTAALRYQQRLTALADSTLRPDSAAIATEWYNLGYFHSASRNLEPAIAAYERAVTIVPARDTDRFVIYRQYANALRFRGGLRVNENRLVDAWNDYERALTLSDQADGPTSQPSMEALLGLVQLFGPLGVANSSAMFDIGPQRILAAGERGLALLEQDMGADDPRVRDVRAKLDVFRMGATSTSLDPRAMRDAAQRALVSAERASGPESEAVAMASLRLGLAYTDLREFPAARAALDRSLRIREKVHGASSEKAAEVVRAMGALLQAERRLPEARAQYERALAMAERALGPQAPELAPYLNALAGLVSALGDTQQARALTARADRLENAGTLDARTAEGAIQALQRAVELDAQGKRDEARQVLEGALGTLERAFGEGHIVVSVTQFRLANIMMAQRDYAAAEALVRRGMAGAARTFGEETPEYAVALAMLADVEKARGDLPAAEQTLQRIVALNARTLGEAHPQGFARRFELADVLLSQRKFPEGGAVVRAAARDVDAYARQVLPTLAVAEQQAFLEQTLPLATTFTVMAARAQPDLMPELYGRLGGWKGLLLRGIDRQAAIARLAASGPAGRDVRRLGAVRDSLAELTQRAATMDAAALRRERERLTGEKESLERRLAELVPETPDRWRGGATLAKQLPVRTAFVDLFRHGSGRQARYVAFVTVAGASRPLQVDLGPAARIDGLLNDWRRAVTADQYGVTEFRPMVAATVEEIAKALPDSLRFIWFSPDAQLSRLPWATLAQFNQRTAVADAAQVPSARALMALLAESTTTTRSGVVLVGGVDFEAGTPGAQRPSTRWQALPGTESEVAAIGRLAASRKVPARSVRGAAATPRSVAAALDSARVVHLATHGFFFGESEAVANSRGVVGASPVVSAGPAVSSRNPLAESGLALAGANVNAAGNLTAEQILGLDLRGLELVVLSACETGRGTEVTGQGVLGLQASLLSAGSRGMLMSLWKVPDESTALLMERFYGYYFAGAGVAEALRDAQRDVMGEERFRNPIHWAGWVFVGTMGG